MKDVYFDPAYGKLYEPIEGGVCETFEYTDTAGAVRYIFIKRPVPCLVDGVQYYDIVTPYGYGGPVTAGEAVPALISGYSTAFEAYCREQGIISEFIRFHPLLNNANAPWPGDVRFCRETRVMDLRDPAIESTQFSAKCRNMIRKAEKCGVEVRCDTACVDMDAFYALYTLTMEKNRADAYYYFPRSYFTALRGLAGRVMLASARVGERIVAASLFLYGGAYMHYHLSATDPACYAYAANNLILRTAAAWGAARGIDWLHLGGGSSAASDDPLLAFKSSFARKPDNRRSFYTGRRIHDPAVYAALVEKRAALPGFDPQSGYFPLYRA